MHFLTLFSIVISTSYVWSDPISHPNEKSHDKVVVCYIGTWAVYRKDRGSFSLEDIEPSLCTHLIYSFAGLDASGDAIKVLDPWQDLPEDYGKNGYGRIVQIKQKNPKLKVSLAIGGWNEGSANYSKLAASPSRRANFVNNAVQTIKKYNFDGLDLDWEFPAKRGGEPHDKENFVSLVKELKTAFSKHGLLLTAALGAGPDTIDVAYDIPGISKYLDYIHLMCYDYHGSWDSRAGPNAPLRSELDNLSVEYTIQYVIKLGAPRNKLVVGIPLYGRTFILLPSENEDMRKFGSLAESKGFSGPFTGELGFMGYNEICLELQKNSAEWEIHWDSLSQTPFAVSGNKFISYDDPKSIHEKVMLAQKYRLAGAMVWSIDTDDFHGDCSSQNSTTKGFPLMRAINMALLQPLPPSDEDERNNEIPHGEEEITKDDKDAASSIYNGNLIYLIAFFMTIGLLNA